MDTDDKKPLDMCDPQDDADRNFRRKNIWHSFMGALYSAVSGAAFIGILTTLVGIMVGTITIAGGFGLATALIMGGVAFVGAVCTYLAQKEFTEIRCIQDENLARKNAKHMSACTQPEMQKLVAPAISAEYTQNQRADGKSWAKVCKSCEAAAGQAIQ